MKILVTTDIFPPDIGGPATFVPTLATGLVQRGHGVTVVTWSRLARHADDEGYAFRLERVPRCGSRALRLGRLLPCLIAHAHRADVIFVNGLLFAAGLVNLATRRPMVAKIVSDLAWEYAQEHGVADDLDTFAHRRYGVSVEWRRRLRTVVLRRLDGVVVPSGYLAGLVSSWGVEPERVHVIPNAVTPCGGPPRPRGPAGGRRRLVTVGRLVVLKNVEGIIEVLPGLPDLELVIIGDGPERACLEARARALGCNHRVIFAGTLPAAEVSVRLQEADVFVLNSLHEGLPHVVLEAFAAGLPVVATAVGGTPELVQDGESGLLVPPGAVARLREAIRTVLDDAALRERLVREGRAVLARHSLPGMIDATETLLARVSGRQPAAVAGTAP